MAFLIERLLAACLPLAQGHALTLLGALACTFALIALERLLVLGWAPPTPARLIQRASESLVRHRIARARDALTSSRSLGAQVGLAGLELLDAGGGAGEALMAAQLRQGGARLQRRIGLLWALAAALPLTGLALTGLRLLARLRAGASLPLAAWASDVEPAVAGLVLAPGALLLASALRQAALRRLSMATALVQTVASYIRSRSPGQRPTQE